MSEENVYIGGTSIQIGQHGFINQPKEIIEYIKYLHKEIERLNSIINELEKWIINKKYEEGTYCIDCNQVLNKLQELKGESNEKKTKVVKLPATPEREEIREIRICDKCNKELYEFHNNLKIEAFSGSETYKERKYNYYKGYDLCSDCVEEFLLPLLEKELNKNPNEYEYEYCYECDY